MTDLDVTLRPGTDGLLDLPWRTPLTEWPEALLVDLPRGISRHEVRFVQLPEQLVVVKELPERAAVNDFSILKALEDERVPSVTPLAVVTGRTDDPHEEASSALVTRYEPYSYSYRQLIRGSGFGGWRNRMLDAFAGLLTELHLIGLFWGDCSLSNVLYRIDAEAVMAIMVDAETASMHEELTEGQREHDLSIMIENVAGGMADIAVADGKEVLDADLALGEDVADRYRALWAELTEAQEIDPADRWLIGERVRRLNELGFEVDELAVKKTTEGERLVLIPVVGNRNFHSQRLRELTGLDVLEFQARQILSDLDYAIASGGGERHGAALSWRFNEFEPWLAKLADVEGVEDPVQAYCDLLWFRFTRSTEDERAIPTEEVFPEWIAAERPGYPLDPEEPPVPSL
ncbi:MAG: DUF4032 domain-containing protein [Acidimicrobiia bacterium]|nr:DUF4032 domain-containing protein [Acidimicrobiia bacterium]